MKKFLPLIALAVQAAIAGEHEGDPHQLPQQPPITVTAPSSSSASSASSSQAASSSTSGGNVMSSSTTYQEVKRAVTGNSSGTNTTAACRYDTHAGLGSVLGGLSFGRSYRDKDCLKLQVANDLWAKGMDIAAVRVYCTIPTIKDALGDDCEAVLNEKHAAARVVSDTVTHEELDRALRSAAQK